MCCRQDRKVGSIIVMEGRSSTPKLVIEGTPPSPPTLPGGVEAEEGKEEAGVLVGSPRPVGFLSKTDLVVTCLSPIPFSKIRDRTNTSTTLNTTRVR